MSARSIQKWKLYFLLVLLAHLLLLLLFSLRYGLKESPKKSASFVPAYIYHGEDIIKGVVQNAPVKDTQTQPIAAASRTPEKKEILTPNIQETAIPQTKQASVKVSNKVKKIKPQEMTQENNFAFSAEMKGQYTKIKQVNQPLLRLLYMATGEHLIYPRIAADFNQTGIVQIKFQIHPNGLVTHVTLLKSSGYEFLDNAALSAIKDMSPVSNVDAYLDKPEFIQVNIVFR